MSYTRPCLFCTKAFSTTRARRYRKLCSKRCALLHRTEGGLQASKPKIVAQKNPHDHRSGDVAIKEAELFFGYYMRCGELHKVRADIDIESAVFMKLSVGMDWVQLREFQTIRDFRKRVLALFDGMVREAQPERKTA